MINSSYKVIPLVLAGALLAACGSSSAQGAGLADKSASQIAQAVSAAVSNASSVHMAGAVDSSGQNISFDVAIVSPKGLSGTMTLQGKGSFKIVSENGATFYVTPDQQFWTSFAGSNSAVVQELVGKCISASGSSAGFGSLTQGVSSLTNIHQLFSKPLSNTSGLTKGAVTTLNGRQVIKLIGSEGSVMDVPTQGDPLPVELSKPGSNGGTVDFDHWNSEGSISAPSGCVDFTQIAGSLASPTP
jgi:hypothetical protein